MIAQAPESLPSALLTCHLWWAAIHPSPGDSTPDFLNPYNLGGTDPIRARAVM